MEFDAKRLWETDQRSRVAIDRKLTDYRYIDKTIADSNIIKSV